MINKSLRFRRIALTDDPLFKGAKIQKKDRFAIGQSGRQMLRESNGN